MLSIRGPNLMGIQDRLVDGPLGYGKLPCKPQGFEPSLAVRVRDTIPAGTEICPYSKQNPGPCEARLGTLTVDREGGRDVGCIPRVFDPHVTEDHVPRLHLAVVGRSGVPVVKDRGVWPAGNDRRVGRVSAAPVKVTVVQEEALELVLEHAGLGAARIGARSSRSATLSGSSFSRATDLCMTATCALLQAWFAYRIAATSSGDLRVLRSAMTGNRRRSSTARP